MLSQLIYTLLTLIVKITIFSLLFTLPITYNYLKIPQKSQNKKIIRGKIQQVGTEHDWGIT